MTSARHDTHEFWPARCLAGGWLALGMSLFPAWSVSAQEPAVEAAAEAAAAVATLPAAVVEKNLASFDLVWTTIRDKHFDPELNGVDWDAVREEFRPKVETAESKAEASRLLSEMIDRLGQSHFGILSASVYESLQEENTGGDGVSGLEVRVLDSQPVVVRVEPGSAGEQAGVQTGWIISRVNGKELAPLVEKVREAYRDSTQLDLRLSGALESRLSGAVGTTQEVEFLDGKGEPRTVSIKLTRPSGTPSRFGHLPTFYVRLDARKIDGDVGYISLNAFFDPARVITKFGESVQEFMDAPGIILDLRGNPGGIGAMAMGLGGWIVDAKGQKLGTMITRDARLNFTLNPRAQTYSGPIAMLVDGCSASTTEILVGGLQDLGRGRVFGTRTAGAALPSVIIRLPNGDGFQYAFANYVAEGGQALEGRGVIPDDCVTPTREQLLDGHDPVLEAALAWIRAQSESGSSQSRD